MADVQRFNLFSSPLEQRSSREGYEWRAAQVGRHIGAERIGATLYEMLGEDWTFPYHFHHGVEELLFVVEGSPTLRAPGGERILEAGDVVCFPSGERGAHSVRGPGKVLVISTLRTPSISVYPDSGKVGLRPPDVADSLDFRLADAVDYWEGE